ncbi:MAG: zinc ribbon domain-containing protein [Dehalococcoidia bacterium]
MPIYEYRCNSCSGKVDVFVQAISVPSSPVCSRCGSQDLSRIFSRFAVRRSKSDKSVYDDILSDTKLTRGLMHNDPRALAEWSRKMSRAADEDSTPETEELLDRMDAGVDVSEIVEEMKPPELRGDAGVE